MPRETAETPNYGVSSLKAARTLKILIKIIKNFKSWDGRATMVRCSGLERSRRGKMCYSNIRTPVHRDAIPKVLGLLYAKFWVQTLGIATLWTGVSGFLQLWYRISSVYYWMCAPDKPLFLMAFVAHQVLYKCFGRGCSKILLWSSGKGYEKVKVTKRS